MVQNKNMHQNDSKFDSIENDDMNNFLLELDENELKKEIYEISNALDNGNLNLSEDEKANLNKELNMISALLDKKLEVHSNSDNHSVVFGSNVALDSSNSSPKDFSFSNNSNENLDSIELDKEHKNILKNDVHSQDLNKSVDFVVDEVVSDSEYMSVEDLTISSSNSADDGSHLVGLVDEDEDILKSNFSSEDIGKSVDVGSVDDALNELVQDYSDDFAIKVENVSMDFKISKDKIDSLKEFIIRSIKRDKSGYRIFRALDDVSFEIKKGDRYGIIGFNGAGKSTLLKLLAGVYDPTEGNIMTKGKIAPLLELGAGFDPNYTGSANIFLNGAFLGYPEDFLKEKYDEIVEFSELGEAIDYHVKTYSSGMRAKLGFSIATIVEPDILIIDEILSVGDIKFRRKSADKMRSLINSGVTVLLVSHAVSQIRDLCNKAIWIDDGKVKMIGEVNKVCDAYVKAADDATKEQLHNLDLN